MCNISRFLSICCLIVAFSIGLTPAYATTFSVCTLTDLNTAITTANTNTQADVINFTCSTTLTLTTQFTILNDGAGNGITMSANGNTVTFNGGSSTQFLVVNPGASLTLDGFTLQNGNSGGDGGAIFNGGTMTISNGTFMGNSTLFRGGAIFNGGIVTISNSSFIGNSATDGGAIVNFGTVTITDSTFMGNSATIGGAIFNGGIVTISNSTFTGNLAGFGGAIYNNIGTLSSQDSHYENNTCIGTITDNGGNTRFDAITTDGCPGDVVTPSPAPATSIVTVLGCALDTTDGVEVANAPDNTYCRVLMKNRGVVDFSGAVPRELIGLGVILAVDVYRLEGGRSINTFPNYARVCLAGNGRLFYMDSRNAPRLSIELASENVDGLTCGWIPAPGTLILTN